jgi:hypothetical protein
MRSVLVVSEVALSFLLLVGAGLLLRSFLRILDVALGFQPSHAAAITINYDDGNDGAKRGVILQEILRQVKALPGIEAAGVTDMLPLDRNRSWGLLNPSRSYPKDEDLSAIVRIRDTRLSGCHGHSPDRRPRFFLARRRKHGRRRDHQ